MTTIHCPAMLVSAIASGQGKTLCTAALARAWHNRGLKVQAFKCGPDFLDPMILQMASSRPVYNLDLGMCGLEDTTEKLYQAAQSADVILIEGVMGLYDGAPSSADLAMQFNLPVLLTVDASAMAQTFGALAAGVLGFKPAIQTAGVIANQLGSAGHGQLLKDTLPPHLTWFGALQNNPLFALPERHLGLHLASEIEDLDARIDASARALAANSPLPLPTEVAFKTNNKQLLPQRLASKTIAIARDEAFCFIYPANLDCLQAMGATLVYFSPLHDAQLPEADAYWLPGGYPELHLEKISQNLDMKLALQTVAKNGTPILAECGGMMALGKTLNGSPVFDVLEGHSQIQARLQGLGTQHLHNTHGNIGAHTFHFGVFNTTMPPIDLAQSQYGQGEAVYRHHGITASFLHFYFPSNPVCAAHFFTCSAA